MAEGGVDMRVHKSFLTNKLGPLPTWAWMLIGLGIAITISVVRADKTAGDKKVAEQSSGTLYGGTTGGSVQEIGGNQRPPVVTQLYNTSIFQPPTGGRPDPPACAPPPQAACAGPSCTTLPAECTPSGQWVSIASSCGPKRDSWSSSLDSIARHCGLPDAGPIWNDPCNAQLKQRRKDPRRCQAGDRVWVPSCPPGGNAPCPPDGPPSRNDRGRNDHDRGRDDRGRREQNARRNCR